MKLISNILKTERARINMSQEELAKKIGKSRISIANYENQKHPATPNEETLKQISLALDFDFSIYNNKSALFTEVHDPIEILTEITKTNGSVMTDYSHDISGRENMETVFELSEKLELIGNSLKKKYVFPDLDNQLARDLAFRGLNTKEKQKLLAPIIAELRLHKIRVYKKTVIIRDYISDASIDPAKVGELVKRYGNPHEDDVPIYRVHNPVYECPIKRTTMVICINDDSKIYDKRSQYSYESDYGMPLKKNIISIPLHYLNDRLQVSRDQQVFFNNNDLLDENAINKTIQHHKNSFWFGAMKEIEKRQSEYEGSISKKEINIYREKFWGGSYGDPKYKSKSELGNEHPFANNLIVFQEDYSWWKRGVEEKRSEYDPKQLEEKYLHQGEINHGMAVAAAFWHGYITTMVEKSYGEITEFNRIGYIERSKRDDEYYYELGNHGNPYVDDLIETNPGFKKYMIDTKQIAVKKKGGSNA